MTDSLKHIFILNSVASRQGALIFLRILRQCYSLALFGFLSLCSLHRVQKNSSSWRVFCILYHTVGAESAEGCEKQQERLLQVHLQQKEDQGKCCCWARQGLWWQRVWKRSRCSMPLSPLLVRLTFRNTRSLRPEDKPGARKTLSVEDQVREHWN